VNHKTARANLRNSTQWRKSSYSFPDGQECVEITTELTEWVGVRDSKLGDDAQCWPSPQPSGEPCYLRPAPASWTSDHRGSNHGTAAPLVADDRAQGPEDVDLPGQPQ
jgi:hypothetical protein